MDAGGESVIKGRTGEWRHAHMSSIWAYYPSRRYVRACSMYYNDATKLWHLKMLHWPKYEPTHFCDPRPPPFEYVEDIVNLSMEHIYADNT